MRLLVPTLLACAAFARHFAERAAAQATAGRKERDRFQYVRLARAIIAGQHDEAGAGVERGGGIGPEVGKSQAGERHRAALSR